MTTLREKRYRLAINTIERLTKQRDDVILKLVRVQHKLNIERLRFNRLAKVLKKPPVPEPEAIDRHASTMLPPASEHDDDLTIPEFLQRGPTDRDKQARAEIEAEQAERKAIKTKARIAKLKATQSGETRRMPLTGRDALKRIREG